MLNCLSAEEYLSENYVKEITSQSKSIEESNESIEVINPFEKKNDEAIEIINPFEQQHDEVIETINPFKQPEVIESNQMVVSTLVVEANSSVEDQNTTLSPYQEALKKAKLEGKIIMIVIRAAHCKYCDKMEKETLSDKSVQEALSANFITVYYNQDLEPLPLELKKWVTPNFVFVDTNENILNQYPGMKTPTEFKEVLAQILSM
jgi:thioredoxin-related protein